MKNKLFLNMLTILSPGTELRTGIHNILDAGIGALIIVGFNETVEKMLDGGFEINCDYSPERLYELAKMDGAIVINEDATKILYANVHIQADRRFVTSESGTRHRTAQRAAQQADTTVIAISERKKVVSLYKNKYKYALKDTFELNADASQALRTLERYKYVLDKTLANLTILELDDLVTIYDAAITLQRFEMLRRIEEELYYYVVELGVEGRLIDLQLAELIQGVAEEENEFIKDYIEDGIEVEDVLEEIRKLNDSELLGIEHYVNALGYSNTLKTLDKKVSPKGYRILGKISRLTEKDVEKIISTYGNIADIVEATEEDLSEIKISKFKIKAIQSGIKRLKFTIELEK